MAIIAKTILVGNNKTEESTPHVHNIKVDGHDATYDHHVLIVDGKEKAISKSSAYMLDMLTKEFE